MILYIDHCRYLILYLLSIILCPTSSTFVETDKFCASSSNHEAVDGSYEFYEGDDFDYRSATTGPIFINQVQVLSWVVKLFAKTSSDSYKYYIGSGSDYTSTMNDNSYPYPYTFNTNEFFTDWWYYDSQWRYDSELRVVNCNALSVNGHTQSELNGRYEWQSFDRTLSGSIYYCETCVSGAGSYLKPQISSSNKYRWAITDGAESYQTECNIAMDIDLSSPADAESCTQWTSWNGVNTITESDISIQRSDLTSSPIQMTETPTIDPTDATTYSTVYPTVTSTHSPSLPLTTSPIARSTTDHVFVSNVTTTYIASSYIDTTMNDNIETSIEDHTDTNTNTHTNIITTTDTNINTDTNTITNTDTNTARALTFPPNEVESSTWYINLTAIYRVPAGGIERFNSMDSFQTIMVIVAVTICLCIVMQLISIAALIIHCNRFKTEEISIVISKEIIAKSCAVQPVADDMVIEVQTGDTVTKKKGKMGNDIDIVIWVNRSDVVGSPHSEELYVNPSLDDNETILGTDAGTAEEPSLGGDRHYFRNEEKYHNDSDDSYVEAIGIDLPDSLGINYLYNKY